MHQKAGKNAICLHKCNYSESGSRNSARLMITVCCRSVQIFLARSRVHGRSIPYQVDPDTDQVLTLRFNIRLALRLTLRVILRLAR